MLINLLFEDPFSFFAMILVVFLSLSFHEYFHAWGSYFFGDETAKKMGRLTLNPFAHIDPIGFLFFLFFGFGWGKPVPFNPLNFKNKKWHPVIVGLMGPFSNFLLVFICALILKISVSGSFFSLFLGHLIYLNLLWGTFNLIPIPPLDGSYLAFLVLEKFKKDYLFFYRYSFLFIVFALILMECVLVPFFCQPIFKLITGFSFI